MVTWSLKKELKNFQWNKRQHFLQMVLVQLAVSMQKNTNSSILILLYRAQVQVDQRSPHENRYIESNRKVSGEKSETHGHRGKFPEQNTKGLFTNIKNRKMGLDKIAKLL